MPQWGLLCKRGPFWQKTLTFGRKQKDFVQKSTRTCRGILQVVAREDHIFAQSSPWARGTELIRPISACSYAASDPSVGGGKGRVGNARTAGRFAGGSLAMVAVPPQSEVCGQQCGIGAPLRVAGWSRSRPSKVGMGTSIWIVANFSKTMRGISPTATLRSRWSREIDGREVGAEQIVTFATACGAEFTEQLVARPALALQLVKAFPVGIQPVLVQVALLVGAGLSLDRHVDVALVREPFTQVNRSSDVPSKQCAPESIASSSAKTSLFVMQRSMTRDPLGRAEMPASGRQPCPGGVVQAQPAPRFVGLPSLGGVA